MYPVSSHSYFGISLASFRAWMDPTSKKEGHCDIIAHSVLLYVLFCLTVHTIHAVHCTHSTCSLFPCFPVSDVEVSSSTSVRALPSVHILSLHLTKHHSHLLSYQCSVSHHLGYSTELGPFTVRDPDKLLSPDGKL